MSAKITSMPSTPPIHKDDQKSKDSHVASAHPVKEREHSSASTESGIREIGREADLRAEREIREHLGDEARRAQPEPEIGPDLEDHNVKSIEKEASDVVTYGPTIDVDLTEEQLKEAQSAKISSRVDSQKNVLGVNSLIAFALWLGRSMKKTHEKITFVFKRGSGK